MPGGGLMSLVAYGSQNVILSGNPEFTFFYKVFKRYSHFSKESITIPIDGPNELFWDQTIKIRAKIPRNADLMSDLNFVFTIPDIYSKYTGVPDEFQHEFQWNRWLGAHIIKNAAFFVGGTKIQEFDSDYIVMKAMLDYPLEKYRKWQRLVGDVPDLISPGSGLNSGGLQTGGSGSSQSGTQYPTNFTNPFNKLQLSKPSIFGQDIYVPLPFWFAESPSKSLPLIALQYHECEVQITLRSIQELYNIRDPSGFRIRPGFVTNMPSVPLTVDTTNILGGVIFSNTPVYSKTPDLSHNFRNFVTDPLVQPPALDNFYYNGRLEATYIYLTDEERKVFASTPLNYLIQQQTTIKFDNLYTRTVYDLEITNPISRIILVPRRSDQLDYKNSIFNFTNWAFYPDKPNVVDSLAEVFYWVQYTVPGTDPPRPPFPNEPFYKEYTDARDYKARIIFQSSGPLQTNAQLNILQSLRILLDGNEIEEEKPISYYTKVTPYNCLNGVPEAAFIPVINFSLNGPCDQPSGSVNASRIRNFQLDVNPYPLPLNTTYVYNLKAIVESYNFFTVEGGMGGLKYAL